jgi:hypothetical protein
MSTRDKTTDQSKESAGCELSASAGSLPPPGKPDSLTVQAIRKRFWRDGFYAVENYDRYGNIHRICQVRGGKVRYMANEWENVDDYFTDYHGNQWEGLHSVFLEGFSEANKQLSNTDHLHVHE